MKNEELIGEPKSELSGGQIMRVKTEAWKIFEEIQRNKEQNK